MKPLPLSLLRRLLAHPAVPLSALVALSSVVHGTDIYWDSDGATAGGSSTTTATGTWGTSAFWSTDATGEATTTATWTSTDTAVFSAGSDVTGASTVTVNANTIAAGLKVEEGSVTFVSAASTKSLTVNSGLTFDKTVIFGAATTATNVNLLLGTNTLTLNNGANVVIYGTNTMGNVNINGGFLLIRGSANTGALGTTGTVTLGADSGIDAATLRIGDTATVARPIALGGTSGTLMINNVGFGTDTKLTGGVTGTNKLVIQSVISGTSAGKVTASTGKLDFTGALTLETAGAGTSATAVGTVIINSEITDKVTSITVQDSSTGTRGAQKVVLGSTANAYTGDTIVSSGILQLGASNVIANGAGKGNVSIAAPGTFDLASFSETINGLSGSGIVDSTAGTTKTLTVGSNDATSSFSGTIKNSTGTLSLTKTGTGTLTLTTENSYSGTTTLGNNAGVIEISHGSALGTGGVALTKGGTNGGTLNLTNDITVANAFTFASATGFGPGGGSAHVRNVSGNNTLTGDLTLNATGGNGINLQSDAGLFTVAGTVTSTVADNTRQLGLGGAGNGEVTGSIVNTGSNAFSVIKSGGGTWTLSGTASYTGSTNVNGGTLQINTTLSGTSGVTIAAGATLQGIGSINTGTVAFSGAGTLSAGNSIGVFGLNAADLTNGTLLVEFGTASIDLLNVAGLLDIAGANVNFSQYAGALDGVNPYVFATYGSLTGGGFLNSFNVPEGYAIDYGSGSNSSISLVAVPEPGTAVLGSVVLLGLFHRRRS